MLKRKALRKILITTFSIITILLICVIPNRLNNNKDYLNPKIDTIYVDNNKTNEIYLLGKNNYLVKTNVIINKDKIEDKVKEIIDYLIVDKSSKIPTGLKGIIPVGTKLNNISIKDKIVVLDFSKEILNISKDLEERMIEAILYSLINIDGIEGVSIKVENNFYNKIPEVLNRSFGINKVYEIDNINNVEKVILYYMEEINNNNYYVPVTKYINDDKDKIKIIIENLSSNYIYESSLVSLLNDNTKLIDYKIEDNQMILNFNDSILTGSEIIEEIIYPISKSVFDNYDVDSILYKVNGKDLTTYKKCCGIINIEGSYEKKEK